MAVLAVGRPRDLAQGRKLIESAARLDPAKRSADPVEIRPAKEGAGSSSIAGRAGHADAGRHRPLARGGRAEDVHVAAPAPGRGELRAPGPQPGPWGSAPGAPGACPQSPTGWVCGCGPASSPCQGRTG